MLFHATSLSQVSQWQSLYKEGECVRCFPANSLHFTYYISGSDILALQQKIFGRWVSQKLAAKNVEIKNIVEDFKDGVKLVQLIEVLLIDTDLADEHYHSD